MLSKYTEKDIIFLLKEIDKGCQLAFAKFYGLYAKRLFGFSIAILHSKEMAEEAVEDVFVKIWHKRGRLAEIENISVYLYVAIKNQSLTKLSQKANDLITTPFDDIDTYVEAIQEDPHSLLISAEMLRRVNEVIANLPPRCKMIFKLKREDGLSYKEISSILNISINTIDVQMAIAVKRICEAMGVTKPKKSPFKIFQKKN
ncbi:MAG: RNA polymerase sigma-70 factor [Niabella sp.]|nr:MAG: RNA polymerase sigma-70 factor [Niabella sp.]